MEAFSETLAKYHAERAVGASFEYHAMAETWIRDAGARITAAEERAERAERERDEARRLLSCAHDGMAQLEGWRDSLERDLRVSNAEGARLDREVERLQDELSAARARVARLEEALRPFAAAAEQCDGLAPDDEPLCVFTTEQVLCVGCKAVAVHASDADFTVGDLRRVRAVMEEVAHG